MSTGQSILLKQKSYLDLQEGYSPEPMIFEKPYEPIVIYDADGIPFSRQKPQIGFDLSIEDSNGF